MRDIVIHHHIFKNAGSSVDYSLRNSFHKTWYMLEGEFPWSSLPNSAVTAFLDAHPDCVAISSHQARIIRDERSGKYRFFPIIFIRHPIDRVGSCYAYERATNTTHHTSVAAQKGLAYYVDYCLGEGDKFDTTLLRNYQTLHLSTAFDSILDTRTTLASEVNLHEAISTIDALPAMGLVEEFSRSAHLLQEWLAPVFQNIKIEATTQNSTDRPGGINEKTRLIRAEIGDRLYEKLLEYNERDIRLYEYSKNKFEQLCVAFRERKGRSSCATTGA